jgi:hypothetical protein
MSDDSKPKFVGPHKELMAELAELIDDLRKDHGTSYVRAGDDKVYALGGDGYLVVFDERLWRGLVEIFTPKNSITVKPNDAGVPEISAGDLDGKTIRDMLRSFVDSLRSYYDNRYWSTPTT